MKKTSPQISCPEFFDLSKPEDKKKFDELCQDIASERIIDAYRSQLVELYAIEHPSEAFSANLKEKTDAHIASLAEERPLNEQGTWVYFPWSATLVHILDDSAFQKVRMARNKNLITEEEQKKFYNATIGIAGLSVGNSAALAIALQGGAQHMKLADPDALDLSNLNRIRAGVQYLGASKVEMTARQIYELNPYAKLDLYLDGLTEKNIEDFFQEIDIIIDEIDNLAMKLRLRQEAKKRRIPLISGADNDRSGVLDIERYDSDPDTLPFHGVLGTVSGVELSSLSKQETGRTIARLIGLENHTERMLSSLQEMGKSIVSWPQLGGTAFLNGALVSHAVLRVANGQPLVPERAIMSLDKHLDGDYESVERLEARQTAIEAFRKILGL